MFYITDTDRMIVKSAWADIDAAEKAANRLRHNSYICEADGFDTFKKDEIIALLESVIGKDPDRAAPRTKAVAVDQLAIALAEVDWTQGVVKAPSAKRNGSCAKVHEIADSMPDASRKEVIAACLDAGINKGTASTQYQKWRQAHAA